MSAPHVLLDAQPNGDEHVASGAVPLWQYASDPHDEPAGQSLLVEQEEPVQEPE